MRVRRFRPELLPSLVTAGLLPLLVALGFWQLGRWEQQTAALEQFESQRGVVRYGTAAPVEFQEVIVRGRYDSEHQFLIDNITHAGTVGYYVITPFAISGSDDWLLINRGWVAADPARAVLPDVAVPGSTRDVRGRVGRLPAAGLALNSPESIEPVFPAVVVYPDVDALGRWAGLEPVLPWVLLLDPADPVGFAARDWQPGGLPPERHLGYAVQWFALAATLIVLWFFLSYRKHDV